MRKNYLRVMALSLTMGIMITGCSPSTSSVNETPFETEGISVSGSDIEAVATTETEKESPTETEATEKESPSETEPVTEEAEISTESSTEEPEGSSESIETTKPTETTEKQSVEYTKEDSTDKPTEPEPVETTTEKPAPTVKSISASVNGTYYIGDNLGAGDFNVKVLMSDGTTIVNPNGFTAAPLNLSSGSTQITVAYKGVSTVITVNATERPVETQPVQPQGAVNGLDVSLTALKYLGLPYVYGGNSLTTGTDCSGFTSLIYAQFGVSLPRTASGQYTTGTTVSLDEAKPGDLVVCTYTGSQYTGHTGIYLGKSPTGEHMMMSEHPDEIMGLTHSAWVHPATSTYMGSTNIRVQRVCNNSYTGTQFDAWLAFMNYCADTNNGVAQSWGYNYKSVTGYGYHFGGFGWGDSGYTVESEELPSYLNKIVARMDANKPKGAKVWVCTIAYGENNVIAYDENNSPYVTYWTYNEYPSPASDPAIEEWVESIRKELNAENVGYGYVFN